MDIQVDRMRFEEVKSKKFQDKTILPTRSTKYSAGYDIFSKEDKVMKPHETYIFWTDVKFKCDKNKFLRIVPRSSIAYKYTCIPINTPGTVDADYYDNEDNEGNIGILMHNFGNELVRFSKGNKIAQAIIENYYTVEGDSVYSKRKGGVGSTGT